MSDSKSEEGGVLPSASIKFTRQFDKIVDANHPLSKSTSNPHLYILEPSKNKVIEDLKKICSPSFKFDKSCWDCIEYYSPNPIVNQSNHLGNELNLIVGAYYAHLLGAVPLLWSNDLGKNFCRGIIGHEKKISYSDASSEDYEKPVSALKKKIFFQGMPKELAILRDETNNRLISESIKSGLLPPNYKFNILFESDFRDAINELICQGEVTSQGIVKYKGLTIATSQKVPLYSTSDIVYRDYLLKNYNKPIILVGKDQENYQKEISKIKAGVEILTVPTLKTQNRKISK